MTYVAPVAWQRTAAPAPLLTLTECLEHLRLIPDGSPSTHPDAAAITRAIAAATAKLDGMAGELGRAILTQQWQFSYDPADLNGIERTAFGLGGVRTLGAVTQGVAPLTGFALRPRGADNEMQIGTFTATSTELVTVAVTAGWDPAVDAERVAQVKAAALLMVGTLYESRESVIVGTISGFNPAAARLIDSVRVYTPGAPSP